ncbi:hypothetical protein MSG28_007954 [Choristoneura fumiferana]|uniref:Uncharacterized protein n=1 Tax=Choristoneura fumiferana TaxID=7141 RepID=A0ACC0J9B7_CHOFU|nr:hypothetical protein MSG28_007954 [Choristoneura fumiferana]
MSNILQPVLDLYPKYSIEKQKCPSYVEMFTKKIEDVVMVYLKIKQTSTSAESAGKVNKNVEDTTTLDSSFIPISREIANFYNMSIVKLPPQDSIPMWILCNPSSEGAPLLLTIQSNEEFFSRGIVDVLVDCKYSLSGLSYSSRNTDELLNAPHGGATELRNRK